MEIATIQGETRKTGGHHQNERLRRRSLVPAVIYGHNQPPETVALSLHDTVLALTHMRHVIKVQLGGQETQYLIKDVQYDHTQQTPIHVDLMRVDVNERVRVKVPIELRGTPKGTAEGGTLVHVLSELDVECLLLQIPDVLRARVDHLDLNEMLHVRDIAVPADVKVLHNPEDIVAVVHPPRGTETAEGVPAEAAEGAAEPEVITKGKEEAEGEGKES
jgi:large subunit ribosomal protein L25